jgi:2-(1,2-epoxy-1,2-dihydrophenyl)acetyl-CoA isomerase
MAQHEFDKVRFEIDGAVATLTLDDQPVLNAIGPRMQKGMKAALDALERSQARALILTGAGRAFSTGANLAEASEGGAPLSVRDTLELSYHPMLRRLKSLPMPLIVAVNGAAAGVGVSFALMGDLILAARSAYFLQAFVRIGLVPDGGSTWLLPRLIGLARARELSLLGEKLSAEKALDWGLINRVCDDEALMGQARALAERLAQGPTRAYAWMRQAYWASLDNSYERQLDLEADLQAQASRTADFREGVAAFLEKRPAKFKGL